MVHVRSATLIEGSGRRWAFTGRPSPGPARWYIEDVAGWAGGAGVRGDVAARLGHGDVVSTAHREGRVLTVKAKVECESSDLRDELEMELSSIMGDGSWGTLEADNGAVPLRTSVRLDGAPQVVEVGMRGLRIQVPLRSGSAFLFGETQRVTVAAAGSGIGLRYPLFSPNGVLDYGAPSQATTGVLTNTGTADAWPVFWPVGDMPSGFRIIQDGHVIEWAGPVALGVPVAVDSERSAVEIAGTDASQLLARDDFQPVRRGASSHITFEPLGGATGYLEATLAPTYI